MNIEIHELLTWPTPREWDGRKGVCSCGVGFSGRDRADIERRHVVHLEAQKENTDG